MNLDALWRLAIVMQGEISGEMHLDTRGVREVDVAKLEIAEIHKIKNAAQELNDEYIVIRNTTKSEGFVLAGWELRVSSGSGEGKLIFSFPDEVGNQKWKFEPIDTMVVRTGIGTNALIPAEWPKQPPLYQFFIQRDEPVWVHSGDIAQLCFPSGEVYHEKRVA